MRDDPCFRCQLPECDDKSPRCIVRKLSNSYYKKHRDGKSDLITADERDANCRIFHIWKLDRMADAAEGVRPYRRKGSPWTGESKSQ